MSAEPEAPPSPLDPVRARPESLDEPDAALPVAKVEPDAPPPPPVDPDDSVVDCEAGPDAPDVPPVPVPVTLLEVGLELAAPLVPPVAPDEVLDPPVLPVEALPLDLPPAGPVDPPFDVPVAGPLLPPLAPEPVPLPAGVVTAAGAGAAGVAAGPFLRAANNARLETSPVTATKVRRRRAGKQPKGPFRDRLATSSCDGHRLSRVLLLMVPPMSLPALAPIPHASPGARHRGFLVTELIEDLRMAQVSRFLDDREIALQKQSRVYFQISGAGHEALLLALARHLRPAYDWFFPYYRDRALMLGLGVTPTQILQEAVGSADDPSSGGRQMPCHWGYKWLNVVSQSSATGSQCISAVGCAEAARYLSRRRHLPGCKAYGDELTYVSLGEGATSQGEFWESLNTACTLHLPVLYVVEDNGYAISVPSSDQSPAPISELVRGFRGLEVHKVDGRDYFASRKMASEALPRVRAGVGPSLIHAVVTRPYSHSAADTQSKYRPAEELADEQAHDPIKLMREELVSAGVLTDEEADQIREEARLIVADSAKEALASRRPDPKTVTENVYLVPHVAADAESKDDGTGDVVAFGEAIKLTLHEQMARDQRIRVFGEDVADAREAVLANVEGKGGVFGTTHGLQREFGLARCYNTPLAEANIIGRAVGQAVRGLRPAPEIQFFDYIWTAMQQIKTEAATMRWRSNGAFSCPMVIRVPIGGYLTGGAIWHSQCGESIFAHVPGLIVLMPSRARDAVGLLRTAFQCSDPVMFLEHKHLLRQPYTKDPFPSKGYQIPLGKAALVQPGNDVTIVTYGATVEKSRQAAALITAEHGASIEILDLRSLVPWDRDRVAESVCRTGRAVVVHEDIYTCGFGAEVSAWLGENCFASLDAPVRRVAATDTHVAYEPTLEYAILPQVSDIVAAVEATLAF